jgi:hypothetical protein
MSHEAYIELITSMADTFTLDFILFLPFIS